MKNLSRLLFVFMLSSMVFPACNATKDLLDVTFRADYEADMDIVVTPDAIKAGINGVFSESATIDPLSNDKFAEYADKIKSITIEEATGTITWINKNAVLITADLNITATDMPSAHWVFTNEPLVQGSVFSLTNEAGQLDKLKDILNAQKVFTVTFSGQTDEDDLSLTFHTLYGTLVVANPL